MAPTLKGFSREYLASLFSYDPESGLITRLVTQNYLGVAGQTLDSPQNAGYLQVSLKGKRMLAHRLAYFLHTGETPQEIDHVDHDRQNNKFENLRAATSSLNKCNAPMRVTNSSGFKGVWYDKSRNRYTAQFQYQGVNRRLGRFKTAEAAARAYDKAAVETVGEFALTNEKLGLLREYA